MRPLVSLVLLVAFALVGFGWRTFVQLRRHGDTGWRFGGTGLDRVVGLLLVLACALAGLAPVVALAAGSAWSPGGPRVLADDGALALVAGVAGVVLAAGSGVLTVVAQLQMGASWRIGVQGGERTELVTGGLFARVRNPIFTGMVGVVLGAALLVPNVLALGAVVVTVVAVQVQVRMVEEPHLLGVHGEHYTRWVASAGRFLPGLGRRVRSRPGPGAGLASRR